MRCTQFSIFRMAFGAVAGFIFSVAANAEIQRETVKYALNGKSYQGEIVFDKQIKEARPGIVIVPEWWGVTQFEKDVAALWASKGYTALVMDYYGGAKNTNDPEKAAELLQAAQKKDGELNDLFDKAVGVLQGHKTVDKKRIAAMGFGFGGGLVVEQARLGKDLSAVVNFYGGLTIPNAKPKPVQAEILVLVGDEDWYVSADQLETFKSEMKSLKAKHEVMVFPGVSHSFANRLADKIGTDLHLPFAFDAKATQDSWVAVEKLFRLKFGTKK